MPLNFSNGGPYCLSSQENGLLCLKLQEMGISDFAETLREIQPIDVAGSAVGTYPLLPPLPEVRLASSAPWATVDP